MLAVVVVAVEEAALDFLLRERVLVEVVGVEGPWKPGMMRAAELRSEVTVELGSFVSLLVVGELVMVEEQERRG